MYTKIVAVVAVLIFIFGVISIIMGLSVTLGILVEPEPGRYLGSSTSGEAIDQGIYRIIFALVIGMLVKISNSVEKLQESRGQST